MLERYAAVRGRPGAPPLRPRHETTDLPRLAAPGCPGAAACGTLALKPKTCSGVAHGQTCSGEQCDADGAEVKEGQDHGRTRTSLPAAQAAGCRESSARDQLVPPAPGRRGQGRQDGADLHEAVQWFAAAHLRREVGRTGWEEVGRPDVQEWIVWLLDWYSAAYASNQFRALQQFFKWLANQEEIPDPMAGMKPPTSPASPSRSSPARNFLSWSWRRRPGLPGAPRRGGDRRARGNRDPAVGTSRDPRRPRQPAAQRRRRYGTVRSPSAARAARPARSRWCSHSTPPAAWTGRFASEPGTPRHTGRSCGSGSTTGAR